MKSNFLETTLNRLKNNRLVSIVVIVGIIVVGVSNFLTATLDIQDALDVKEVSRIEQLLNTTSDNISIAKSSIDRIDMMTNRDLDQVEINIKNICREYEKLVKLEPNYENLDDIESKINTFKDSLQGQIFQRLLSLEENISILEIESQKIIILTSSLKIICDCTSFCSTREYKVLENTIKEFSK